MKAMKRSGLGLTTHGPVRVLIFDDNDGTPNNLLYDGEAIHDEWLGTHIPSLYGLSGSVYIIASHILNSDPEAFMVDGGVDYYPDNIYTLTDGSWATGDAWLWWGLYDVSSGNVLWW